MTQRNLHLKKIFTKQSLLFFILLLSANVNASDKECSSDESLRCTFTGSLELHNYPGPPNYSDITKGDTSETHLYLKLDQPVSVHFSDWDKNGTPAIEQHSLLQIGGDFDDLFFKVAKNKNHVTIKGSLFESFSGHHHTHFLIDPENRITLDKQ